MVDQASLCPPRMALGRKTLSRPSPTELPHRLIHRRLDYTHRAIEAADIIGHTNFWTTERHYLAGRRHQATARAHAALESLRDNRQANTEGL